MRFATDRKFGSVSRRRARCFGAVGLLLVAGCKETTSGVVSEVVKGVKDTAAGVAEGVKEGRKEGESSDGAVIVADGDDLRKHLEVSVFELRAVAGKPAESEIVLALSNSGERAVRLAGLSAENAVLLIDKEGFSHDVAVSGPKELTVPPKAKVRMHFTAAVAPAQAATFRLWLQDFALDALEPKPASE